MFVKRGKTAAALRGCCEEHTRRCGPWGPLGGCHPHSASVSGVLFPVPKIILSRWYVRDLRTILRQTSEETGVVFFSQKCWAPAEHTEGMASSLVTNTPPALSACLCQGLSWALATHRRGQATVPHRPPCRAAGRSEQEPDSSVCCVHAGDELGGNLSK